MTAPRDDEEWRKKITAALVAGQSILNWDNVEHQLTSPSLAAVLTTRDWCDRVLGRTEMVTVPQRATWLVTGNNLRVGGDIARRCYWCRMDAQVASPWQRVGFRYPRLLDYVLTHRGAILGAALTLARGWFAAGCPKATVPMIGSFEDWAETLGGVLGNAEIKGFLDNLDKFHEQVDEEEVAWESVLAAWDAAYGKREVTVAEITRDLMSIPQQQAPTIVALREALPAHLAESLVQDGGRNFGHRLGAALAKRADGVFGSLRLLKVTGGKTKKREK